MYFPAALLGHTRGVIFLARMHSHLGDDHTRLTLWGMRNAEAIFAILDYRYSPS